MAHISRKELKKDQIRAGFMHGAEAVVSHWRTVWQLAIPVLVVLAAVGGWRFYSERQAMKASAALADAMTVYDARIRTAGEPEQPGETRYLDEKNKYADAVKKLEAVAGKYPRTRPGQLARYYAAISLERLDRYADAEKPLLQISSSGDADLAAVARFELAQNYDHSGKGDQAVPLYQQLLSKPSVLVPKPLVLLAFADHYRQSNPQQAAKLYNQVKSEFPNTGIADEADKRLEQLPGKS
jgi:tetratricopeptide (TPR) repeat protein